MEFIPIEDLYWELDKYVQSNYYSNEQMAFLNRMYRELCNEYKYNFHSITSNAYFNHIYLHIEVDCNTDEYNRMYHPCFHEIDIDVNLENCVYKEL